MEPSDMLDDRNATASPPCDGSHVRWKYSTHITCPDYSIIYGLFRYFIREEFNAEHSAMLDVSIESQLYVAGHGQEATLPKG